MSVSLPRVAGSAPRSVEAGRARAASVIGMPSREAAPRTSPIAARTRGGVGRRAEAEVEAEALPSASGSVSEKARTAKAGWSGVTGEEEVRRPACRSSASLKREAAKAKRRG